MKKYMKCIFFGIDVYNAISSIPMYGCRDAHARSDADRRRISYPALKGASAKSFYNNLFFGGMFKDN